MKRYFLILLPEDPAKKAKISDHGNDRGAAMDEYNKLREKGCPAGFCQAIVTSNTSLHKHVDVVPTVDLAKQADAARAQSAREIEDRRQSQIQELLERRSEIDSSLVQLGVQESSGSVASNPPVQLTPEQRVAALKAKQIEIAAELLELGVDAMEDASSFSDASTGSEEGKPSEGSDDPANPQTSLV